MARVFEGRNFAGRSPKCADGDEFIKCNLAQAQPGTEICKGRKGLHFTKCNLARAVVPADSTITDCNTSSQPLPSEADEKAARIESIDAQIADLEAEKLKLEAQ